MKIIREETRQRLHKLILEVIQKLGPNNKENAGHIREFKIGYQKAFNLFVEYDREVVPETIACYSKLTFTEMHNERPKYKRFLKLLVAQKFLLQ
jgi:hypothetical protein